MTLKAIRFSLVVLAASSLPALSATTQADADKVRDALKPYLGPFTDTVKITPFEEGFKASLDLAAVLADAKKKDVDITLSPIELTATPLGANKWKLHREGDFSLAAKFPGGYINEQLTGMTYDATLDMDQGIITESAWVAKAVTVDEELPAQGGMKSKVKMAIDGLSAKSTAKVNPEGGTDVTVTEPFGPFTFSEHLDNGKQPVDVSGKSAGGTAEATIIGLRGKPILDIWKFGVAHVDKKPTADDQNVLKTALAAALPIFKSFDSKGSFGKLDVTTPMGVFSVDNVGFASKANGLVKEGYFQEAISLDGLTLPAGIAPAWSTSLVPKNLKIDFNFSGYDFATISKGFIEASDFTKADPVAPEILAKLQASVLPAGIVTVGLGPSAVSNSAYNLTAEGSFAAGPAAQPSGKAKIKLTGMDEVMKAINGAPPEARLKDASAVMIVAKGLGKAEADGSITWNVEATADGQVLVNGTDVKKLK